MKAGIKYLSIVWFVAFRVFPVFSLPEIQDTASLFPDNYKASYYDSLGMRYSQHADNQQAIKYFKQAIALKKADNDSLGMASTYEHMSRSFQLLKEYKKAIFYQLLASELKTDVINAYYQKVKQLIPKANDSLNLTRLYYRFGLYISRMGRQKEATAYYQEALKMALALHYDKAISTIANELAGEYWDLGMNKLSFLHYRQSLSASLRLNDSNRIAAVYLNLGDNYKEQGNLDQGMEMLLKALKIKEFLKDSSHLSFFYIKAAEISKLARNNKKQEEYIHKAYAVKDLDHCANPMEKAIIYQILGNIAREKGHYQKALLYSDTLMRISRKNAYVNGIKTALKNKAALYRIMGKPALALRLLEKADKYATENPYYQISSRNAKAELYLETHDYNKAYQLLKKNIESPVLSNYANDKLQTLKLFYKTNTELARYKEAFQWNDSLRRFENRLRDKDMLAKVAELETRYQSEKNKHTINLLLAKNQIYDQQIRVAILLIIILVVFIAFGVFISRLNKLKAEFRENNLRQQLLRSQMNPHFIFNALSSIQQMIRQRETEKAEYYLGRFASITRLVLEHSREESITLDKELEVLQSYIALEQLRYGNRFEYKISYSDDLETEFIRIPPLALQPFVENAIKHGLKDKEQGGLLLLSFEDLGDILKVVIEDNGSGIYHDQGQKPAGHKSMAMQIFEERRKLMQRRYRKKLYIRFIDLSSEGKSGTRVIIHLPIL